MLFSGVKQAAANAKIDAMADEKAELMALIREMADALDFARSVASDDYNGRAVAKKADALTAKAAKTLRSMGSAR